MSTAISLSLSIKKKQQNVLLVNGYMQVETSNISNALKDSLDHLNPIQLDHLTIQKNYTELKKMFTPNPLLIKSIPFCLYNIPIWHTSKENKDFSIFYTKLIINQWICTIVVKSCVFDFVRFEKYKTPTRTLYTDYDMCIVINENAKGNNNEILECGYITEKNPIDM